MPLPSVAVNTTVLVSGWNVQQSSPEASTSRSFCARNLALTVKPVGFITQRSPLGFRAKIFRPKVVQLQARQVFSLRVLGRGDLVYFGDHAILGTELFKITKSTIEIPAQ